MKIDIDIVNEPSILQSIKNALNGLGWTIMGNAVMLNWYWDTYPNKCARFFTIDLEKQQFIWAISDADGVAKDIEYQVVETPEEVSSLIAYIKSEADKVANQSSKMIAAFENLFTKDISAPKIAPEKKERPEKIIALDKQIFIDSQPGFIIDDKPLMCGMAWSETPDKPASTLWDHGWSQYANMGGNSAGKTNMTEEIMKKMVAEYKKNANPPVFTMLKAKDVIPSFKSEYQGCFTSPDQSIICTSKPKKQLDDVAGIKYKETVVDPSPYNADKMVKHHIIDTVSSTGEHNQLQLTSAQYDKLVEISKQSDMPIVTSKQNNEILGINESAKATQWIWDNWKAQMEKDMMKAMGVPKHHLTNPCCEVDIGHLKEGIQAKWPGYFDGTKNSNQYPWHDTEKNHLKLTITDF